VLEDKVIAMYNEEVRRGAKPTVGEPD
jgi:hypothetical protein